MGRGHRLISKLGARGAEYQAGQQLAIEIDLSSEVDTENDGCILHLARVCVCKTRTFPLGYHQS